MRGFSPRLHSPRRRKELELLRLYTPRQCCGLTCQTTDSTRHPVTTDFPIDDRANSPKKIGSHSIVPSSGDNRVLDRLRLQLGIQFQSNWKRNLLNFPAINATNSSLWGLVDIHEMKSEDVREGRGPPVREISNLFGHTNQRFQKSSEFVGILTKHD